MAKLKRRLRTIPPDRKRHLSCLSDLAHHDVSKFNPGRRGQMTPILHLGPLALATDRLAAVAAIWLFVAIGSSRRMAGDDPAAISLAAAGGFIVARLAYVGMHLSDFLQDPLDILKVWQGGFLPLAGIAAAILILGFKARPERRFRLIVLLIVISGSWFIADRSLKTSGNPPFAASTAGLKTLAGADFDPAILQGKPYVINLWADWCPPCRREMPLLAEAARGHPDVVFLFINQGDTAVVAGKLPTKHGISNSTVVLDESASLSAKYGGALPSTLFVGADGTVRSVHAGEISRAALSEKINLIKETRS